jgi:hypothetical protein
MRGNALLPGVILLSDLNGCLFQPLCLEAPVLKGLLLSISQQRRLNEFFLARVFFDIRLLGATFIKVKP